MKHKHFCEKELFAHAPNYYDLFCQWEGANDALKPHG